MENLDLRKMVEEFEGQIDRWIVENIDEWIEKYKIPNDEFIFNIISPQIINKSIIKYCLKNEIGYSSKVFRINGVVKRCRVFWRFVD